MARQRIEHTPGGMKKAAKMIESYERTGSVIQAADESGIPIGSVARVYERLKGSKGSMRHELLAAMDEEILDQAAELTQRGLEQVIDKLPEMKDSDAIKAAAVGHSIVAERRQYKSGGVSKQGESLGSVAAMLAEFGGGKVTVQVDMDDDAIEVEGLEVPDETT